MILNTVDSEIEDVMDSHLDELEYVDGEYKDDTGLVTLSVKCTFKLRGVGLGRLVPLFFDNRYSQPVAIRTILTIRDLLKPYLDDNHIVEYADNDAYQDILARYDLGEDTYFVSFVGPFLFKFEDKKAVHIYKLKNEGIS